MKLSKKWDEIVSMLEGLWKRDIKTKATRFTDTIIVMKTKMLVNIFGRSTEV